MVHIAVIGCSHGEIDTIYDHIAHIEQERQIKVELVLCCGDFQSVRNMTDLRCMNCPIKYQAMHDFHRYYSGEKIAPILTIFIGGNHEASNFLQELPYGGWVAPNIYFCGFANVLKFGSLRIAGISGIFKGQDYLKGRHECPPYDQNTIRSTYHYRNLDIFRLKQIKSHVDIVLSHDWPRGIYNFGNIGELLRRKPFFRDEVQRNELGSRPLFEVLTQLEPSHWFSAHLHVQFGAIVPHAPNANGKGSQFDSEPKEQKVTRFLALDKVLPRRHYLQVLEIPMPTSPVGSESEGIGGAASTNELRLSLDPEWLAILKSTDHLNNAKPKPCFMPGPGCGARYDFTPSEEEIEEVNKLFKNEFEIPCNFVRTAPVFQRGEKPKTAYAVENPQTTDFCTKLGVTDPISLCIDRGNWRNQSQSQTPNNSSYIGSDTGSFSSFSSTFQEYSPINVSMNSSSFKNTSADTTNPDEIPLDLDDDDDNNQASGGPASGSRLRMKLPPPKSTSTPCRPDTTDERQPDDQEETPATARELDLLGSIFGNPEDNNDSGNDLFVLDRTGTSTGKSVQPSPVTPVSTKTSNSSLEEPDLKRMRNEALLKALEEEEG